MLFSFLRLNFLSFSSSVFLSHVFFLAHVIVLISSSTTRIIAIIAIIATIATITRSTDGVYLYRMPPFVRRSALALFCLLLLCPSLLLILFLLLLSLSLPLCVVPNGGFYELIPGRRTSLVLTLHSPTSLGEINLESVAKAQAPP